VKLTRRLFKVDPRKIDLTVISTIADIVGKGGIIVYPTDTVYGLGCDPFNINAVRRVFEIKGRERKPLPVLASSIKDAERIAILHGKARVLAEHFWPGPLTIVVPKVEKSSLPGEVTAGENYIGVRVPDHPVAIEIIRAVGGLLIGTSANKSGGLSPRTATEAILQVGNDVDAIVDSGPSRYGISSTVIKIEGSKISLIREGAISFEEIESIL